MSTVGHSSAKLPFVAANCACPPAEHDAHDDRCDWPWETLTTEQANAIFLKGPFPFGPALLQHLILAFAGPLYAFLTSSLSAPGTGHREAVREGVPPRCIYGKPYPSFRVPKSLLGTLYRYVLVSPKSVSLSRQASMSFPQPKRHMTTPTDVELPLLWAPGLRISFQTTSGRPTTSSCSSIITSNVFTY